VVPDVAVVAQPAVATKGTLSVDLKTILLVTSMEVLFGVLSMIFG
jgi:hypothetical protein